MSHGGPTVCATCRKSIAAGVTLFRCSVTACNAGKLKLAFCTRGCWEKHVPTARHRGASCREEVAGGGPPGDPHK
jgi:hypothetical protein